MLNFTASQVSDVEAIRERCRVFGRKITDQTKVQVFISAQACLDSPPTAANVDIIV
jgi:hypothetical protein